MSKIAEIIKYEGDNSTFIWKHPLEDFNSMTQLIVHESQEAVFFMNGQALDLFGPGRYTLETQNLPKLGKILNRNTGGDTPFHCEVYFINKTVQMALKWGSDSKVRFIEPTMGIPFEIGASGEMNLAVCDSRKLLIQLVGTMNGAAWAMQGSGFTKSLHDSFKPLISTAVKSNLSAVIKRENIDLLEIDENLEKLSAALRAAINPGFEEYGLTIPQFYVTNVLLPDDKDENFKNFKRLHAFSFETKYGQAKAKAEAEITAAKRMVELESQTTETEVAKMEAERQLIRAQADAEAAKMAGFAEAEVMAAQGYNQKDVIQADVQKAYAEGIGNMGPVVGGNGGVVGDMVGLGVGMAAASAISPQLSEMMKGMTGAAPAEQVSSAKCAKCGAALPANAKFCLECGERIVPADSVVCPECGKTVVKGKFCPECGFKFQTNCPKCGFEIANGTKFCPECGEKL